MPEDLKKYLKPQTSTQDNTRVKLQPKTSIADMQTNKLALKAKNDAEIKRRGDAISKSNASKPLSREAFANTAAGEKLRAFPNDPNSVFDEYINPAKMIGDMADNIGHNFASKDSSVGAKALSIATPLLAGALAGVGAKGTSSFVNNLVNPLAGTGSLAERSLSGGSAKYYVNNGKNATRYLHTAENWLDKWHSSPIIKERVAKNNGSQHFMNEAGRGLPKSKVGIADPRRVKLEFGTLDDHAIHYQERGTHLFPDNIGVYFRRNHPDAPEALRGRAFVDDTMGPHQTTSTGIHEGTHQITDGNKGLSFQNRDLLESMLDNKGMRKLAFGNSGTTVKDVQYLTKPTELHARINQLRYQYSLTPDMKITPELAGTILDDVRNGATPVTKHFGQLVTDNAKFANVLNKMFTPAAAVGTGAALINKNNAGQNKETLK